MRLLLAWCLVLSGGLIMADAPKDTELFRKHLDDGRELVVIRGPLLDKSVVHGFYGSDPFDYADSVYGLRLEIHAAGQPPLVLWSFVQGKPREPIAAGIAVQDVMVHPDQIVMAVLHGAVLTVYRIRFDKESGQWAYRVASLDQIDWSLRAAVLPHDPSLVQVELGRTEDGRVTAYVGDLDGRGRGFEVSHGIFEQAGDDEWEFVAVESTTKLRPSLGPQP